MERTGLMSKAKDKGRRLENAIVDELVNNGIPAIRVPLSGSLGGAFSDDVIIGSIDSPIARIECKNRESISQQIWDWLEGVNFLALKRNHKPMLIVMEISEFTKLWSK